MIHSIHQTIFYLHLLLGSIALIAFWLPIFSKKGSKRHIQSGKAFAWSMYAVSISGLIMTIMALAFPIATYAISPEVVGDKLLWTIERIRNLNSFLFMLSLLVFCTTHHALMVVKHKTDRDALKTSNYLLPVILLGISGLIMIGWGAQKTNILHMVFGGISAFASFGIIQYVFRKDVAINAWLIEHFSGLIGSGIGAYTAFFAFGGRRVLDHIFVGYLQLIPWIAPSIIGIAFTMWLTRKYSIKKSKSAQNQASSISSLNNEVANAPLGSEKVSSS